MDWSALNIPVPILTFVLGWLVARFTLSKSDKRKLEQDYFKNTQELRQRHDSLYEDYCRALRDYTTCEGDPTYELFFDVAVKGDRYFGHMNVISDAIMSGKVDRQVRDSTFVPGLCKAASKSLPRHYEVLQEIAKKKKFKYSGKLEREEYTSLFSVVEKLGRPSVT